ncbi:MAG: SAM-dependent methyltransferase [Bacteroidota bacterium]|jgi:hypothetical protein
MINSSAPRSHPSSFKDPHGYIKYYQGKIHRVINPDYEPHYNKLTESGLYNTLIEKELLVKHEEVEIPTINNKVLLPQQLQFISYPYEWCFDQLKDAALLTLTIQETALQFGMTLKDANAYNIQFLNGKPIFIDTSSFEILDEQKPWIAYGQFCRHFLGPLALMSKVDLRLNHLFRHYIDGIPLDLTSKLLPLKSKFNLGLYFHLHLHAKSIIKSAHKTELNNRVHSNFSLNKHLVLIKHLKNTVNNLELKKQKTAWDDYYTANNNYTNQANKAKATFIEDALTKVSGIKLTWDIGANDGKYSSLVSAKGIPVVAMDVDENAVNQHYTFLKQNPSNILPLIIDLGNPTGSKGWALQERNSILERQKPDLVLALALIHHIVFSLNVPLDKACSFFHETTNDYLIIEFVLPIDEQVIKLKRGRDQIFSNYSQDQFESIFSEKFEVITKQKVEDSQRILYLMQKKHG